MEGSKKQKVQLAAVQAERQQRDVLTRESQLKLESMRDSLFFVADMSLDILLGDIELSDKAKKGPNEILWRIAEDLESFIKQSAKVRDPGITAIVDKMGR